MLAFGMTGQFKKDRRRCIKRGWDMGLLSSVVTMLRIPSLLPPEAKDHPLTGNWADHRECHIQPDWVLIYRIEGNKLVLYRTGSHSDLF